MKPSEKMKQRKATDAKAYSQVIRGLMSAIEASRRIDNNILTLQMCDSLKYAQVQYNDCMPVQ